MKKWGLGIAQVALLMVFSLLMDLLARTLHLPVPGSILGMVVLFILLQTRVVKLRWIEVGLPGCSVNYCYFLSRQPLAL